MIQNTGFQMLVMIFLLILVARESYAFTISKSTAGCTIDSSNSSTRYWMRVSVGHRPMDNKIDSRLFSNTNDNDISSSSSSSSSSDTTNKRRKRKDGKNVVPSQKDTTAATATNIDNSPSMEKNTASMNPSSIQEKDAPKQVTMQIMDVRDVVSGKSTMNAPSNPDRSNTFEKDTNNLNDNDVDDDDDEEEEEYEYYYEDENGNEIVLDTVKSVSSSTKKTPTSSFTSSSSSSSSSLDDILADARRLRQEQKDAIASGAPDPEELSIPKLLKGAISNIVTVDFFLVCGLLAWFLGGIFCSYVLKDDTVQIAFNMQFERVVQPALGILMIGAAAGAVFKEPSEDEK